MRTGIIAVVGRPNVGKSTFINKLLGKELSITSKHPHTTRHQIRAIENGHYQGDDYQIVYVDTPGIHKPRSGYAEQLNDFAYEALKGVDLVIAIFDGSQNIGKGDAFIANRLSKIENVFVVLNKCDSEPVLLKVADRSQELIRLIPNARHLFISSAFTGKNIHIVKEEILKTLEESPQLFDTNVQIDLTDEQIVAELFREALIRLMREELPQSIAVIAREDSDLPGSGSQIREFSIIIMVLKDSHKPIVIGKDGSILESAGISARKKAEILLGSQVVMHSKVVVDKNWQSGLSNADSYFS